MVYNFNSRPNEYRLAEREVPLLRLRQQDAALRDAGAGRRLGARHGASGRTSRRASSATRSISTRSISPHKYLEHRLRLHPRGCATGPIRIFEKTAEDIYRVSFDSIGNQYVTLRTKFEHSTPRRLGLRRGAARRSRRAAGHAALRHRQPRRATASRPSLIVTPVAVPRPQRVGRHRHRTTIGDTGFGLRNNNNSNWSLGVDVVPTETRQLRPQLRRREVHRAAVLADREPADARPTRRSTIRRRDWWTDQGDKVKTYQRERRLPQVRCRRRTSASATT